MTLALRSVIDIPETDVVSFLHDVISSQPKTQQDGDSMQVDVPTDTATSPVPDLLALCVTYSTSAAAMRVALRKHIREADELVVILAILVDWIEAWYGQEEKFLPEEAKKGEKEKEKRKEYMRAAGMKSKRETEKEEGRSRKRRRSE